MKVETRTILGASIFLTVIGLVYWFWSYEASGIALLIFGGAAYLMLAGYLFIQWRRRHGIPRVEDRFDATPSDGAGEIGFFPSASIWPAGMGIGATFLGIGLIYGVWYWVIGGALFVGATIGFVVESDAHE